MNKQKNQRCNYKNNGCKRNNINESVLKHMCEGSLYFKCSEYLSLFDGTEEKEIDLSDVYIPSYLL